MYNSIEYVSGLVDLTKRNIDFNIERYTTVLKDYYKKTDDEILDFVDKEKDLLEYKLFYLNRNFILYIIFFRECYVFTDGYKKISVLEKCLLQNSRKKHVD